MAPGAKRAGSLSRVKASDPERSRTFKSCLLNTGLPLDRVDPFHPVETGYFIPATTERTRPFCRGEGAERRCKTAVQTNNAEVDDRGYIYTADRVGTGLHILQLSGDARAVVNQP